MCQEKHDLDESPPCMNKLVNCAQDINALPRHHSLGVESRPSGCCCRSALLLCFPTRALAVDPIAPPATKLSPRHLLADHRSKRVTSFSCAPPPYFRPSLTTSCVCRRSFEGSSGYRAVFLSLNSTAPSTPDTPTNRLSRDCTVFTSSDHRKISWSI